MAIIWQRKRLRLGLGLALAFALLTSAFADDSCVGDLPLMEAHWTTIPLDQTPKTLGEWRLPISATRPGTVTEARLQTQLVQTSKGDWKLRLAFSFPDPKPYGIPFTFQKAELDFTVEGEFYTAMIDWSQDCTGPGRGMFPGQAWTELVDLPPHLNPLHLERTAFRLFGARF